MDSVPRALVQAFAIITMTTKRRWVHFLPPKNGWRSDDAVSEVLGQILLVGITITTMVGLTILVMNIDGPLDKTHADIEYQVLAGLDGWSSGDEAIQLEHVGGEAVDRDRTLIRFIKNGAAAELDPSALDGAWDDGTFSMTETWAFTTTISFGDELEILIIDTQETTITSSTVTFAGSSAVGGTPILTYVDTATANHGIVTNIDAAKDPDDGQSEATLEEIAAASVDEERIGSRESFSSVSNSGNDILTSNNVRTRFDSSGDFVRLDSFTNPADVTAVNSVRLVLEGQRPSSGGADPILRLSYDVATVAGATTGDITITSVGTDVEYAEVDITGDRAWTPDNIEDMRIRAERLSVDSNFAHADIDKLVLRVNYGLTGGSKLDVEFTFNNVPAGISQQLELEYRRVSDDFHVEVHDGSVWVERGILLAQGTPTVWTYTLSPDEYQSGTVRIRFIDETPGSAGVGFLLTDYARVRTI